MGRYISNLQIFDANCFRGTRRVADPVHFQLDPATDPENQNFKNWIRILMALTKNQYKHLNFFHFKHISTDIEKLFLFIQLYIVKVR